MILFVSKCPDNCLNCTSATLCTKCWTNFTLNYADNLCYQSCPQATYPNATMYLLGNVTSGSYDGNYVETFI